MDPKQCQTTIKERLIVHRRSARSACGQSVWQQRLRNSDCTKIAQQRLHSKDCTEKIAQQRLHNNAGRRTPDDGRRTPDAGCRTPGRAQRLHNKDCTTTIAQQRLHDKDCFKTLFGVHAQVSLVFIIILFTIVGYY